MTRLVENAAASLHPSILTTNEANTVKRALRIIEKKRIKTEPILFYLEDFVNYLKLRFAGLTNEQGHVLYLDIDRRLLAADTEFIGDQTRVSWDIRKIILKAITLGAEHLVLAHNHPNDNPTPSDPDLGHLKYLEDSLGYLNINVLDSYVVTSHGIASIKDYRKKQEELKWERRRKEGEIKREQRRAKRAANKAAKEAVAKEAKS